MLKLEDKQILVIGLGGRGQAACEFLRRSGAKVVGVDHADSHDLRRGADRLRPLGIEVALGVLAPPEREFNLAILSSALPTNTPVVEAVLRSNVPLISELETLRATRPGPRGEPNLWLIAGGKDKGLEFHDVGPLLAKRVKRAFLVVEARERIRAAWSHFTTCTVAGSLLETVAEAAKNATSGDVVLLAPACSSWDQFRNHQQRGEVFCQAVKSIGRGVRGGTPNIHGRTVITQQ